MSLSSMLAGRPRRSPIAAGLAVAGLLGGALHAQAADAPPPAGSENVTTLDLVNVVLKIQDHFDVAIDDEDMPNLRRVSDLVTYVAARHGSAAA